MSDDDKGKILGMDGEPAEEEKKEPEAAEEPIPVGEWESDDCGCRRQKMSNDTVRVVPCLPCGLEQVANHLSEAAWWLSTTAKRVATERDAVRIAQAKRRMDAAVRGNRGKGGRRRGR